MCIVAFEASPELVFNLVFFQNLQQKRAEMQMQSHHGGMKDLAENEKKQQLKNNALLS